MGERVGVTYDCNDDTEFDEFGNDDVEREERAPKPETFKQVKLPTLGLPPLKRLRYNQFEDDAPLEAREEVPKVSESVMLK